MILKQYLNTRILLAAFIVSCSLQLRAQSQAVSTLKIDDGTSSTTFNSNALLDLQSNSKGVLMPRIALSSTILAAPMGTFTAGMVVYNTATAGDVTPGYYYSTDAKWVRIADAADINNIYTANGTLTAARTVTMPYTLTFTNTGSSTQPFIFSNGDALVNGVTVGMGTGKVSSNTALGASALAVATGSNNTAVGSSTLKVLTTAHDATAVGNNALSALTTGDNNTAVGGNALRTNISGTDNTAVGANSLLSATSSGNTAVGRYSLTSLTTGSNNTALGLNALEKLTTTSNNTAVGLNAAQNFTTGANNVIVGSGAANNSAYISGDNNTYIGTSAAANSTSGSNNISIGYNTDLPGLTSSNQLNIGNCIFGTGLTGSNSSGTITPAGLIGVGTTAPAVSLDVAGTPASTSTADGVRPPSLTRAQLIAKTTAGTYTSTQTGVMVYVNEVATGTLTTATAKVTSIGYYYWDGSVWQGMGGMPSQLKFMYMPTITISTATTGVGLTLDLYSTYKNQFASPVVSSTGATASIPYYTAATDLYYYITKYDASTLANISIDASGVMTYDVITTGTEGTYVNIVFVPKN